MKRRFLFTLASIVSVIIIVYFVWCYIQPRTTVLLLRHADRQGSQDALNADGNVRAAELVHVMEKAGITAIYHSEAFRTERTAQDTADALGIMPTQIDASDVSGLVADVLGNRAGQTVMVVSHSNRVPDIIEALGGGVYPDINHDEYDDLFVVTRCHCGWQTTKVTNLQYGAVSP